MRASAASSSAASAGMTNAGTLIVSNSARSRLLLLGAIAAVALALVVFVIVWGTRGTSPAAERLMQERLQGEGRTAACYSDEECPDGTFCSGKRLCVPLAALPPLAPPLLAPLRDAVTSAAVGVGETIGRAMDRVLGRGRGGEGSEVQQVSSEKKGENP